MEENNNNNIESATEPESNYPLNDAPEEESSATKKIITVQWNGEERQIPQGKTLEEILGSEQATCENPALVAKANQRLVELCYVPEDGDTIIPLDLTSPEGNRTYQRGLLHTLVRAVRAVLPDSHLKVESVIDSGLYCEIISSTTLDPFIVDRIGRKMREYVDKNSAFVQKLVGKDDAITLYRETNQPDKARLLAFREHKTFKIYSADGYSDYFYGHMPPSTKYLQRFRLIYEMPGLVLLFPRNSDPSAPFEFNTPRKLMHVFRESDRWANILRCNTVADLNELAQDEEKLSEFILINEARHDAETHDIAKEIESSQARVVLIAGPSSSGKTTFTQKLRLQLRMRGKEPIMLSLDNYYIDRDQIPLQDDGSIDLENINTLDLPLFNEHLRALLDGQEVELPRFNFETGRRDPHSSRFLRLAPDDILLIEGIHGLNDSLTTSVANNQKFKIYISALTQLNLDYHNRISTTDVRLLRRLVRDFASRDTEAEATLQMWPSVRAGENQWIFPFQERADVMFNSTLVYELLYLKQEAAPLLAKIPQDSEFFSEANRLLKFLNYFITPTESCRQIIPNTSLLREFIGGGVFDR